MNKKINIYTEDRKLQLKNQETKQEYNGYLLTPNVVAQRLGRTTFVINMLPLYYNKPTLGNLPRGKYDVKLSIKVNRKGTETIVPIDMKEILKLEDRPTAVFCGNDSIAMGAYKAIRENKLKIPEDISIIGFNDLKLSQYSIPPLTTIKIDTKLIAQETVNSLIELLEGKRDYHKKVFLPIELIERESCQKI